MSRLLLALVLFTALPAATQEIHLPVALHSLANGLKVVTLEEHAAPVAVVQIWYHVGSKDEVAGRTGLAHLLEHNMFNGTHAHPPGTFSRLVAKAGGDDNAFTSFDYTAYYEKFAADRLALGLELEADRMRNILLTATEFDRERQVVKEERRMRTEDNPESALVEQVNAAAFVAHPYGRPVIGWMEDLDRLAVDDLRGFYERYYRPDNATLVVVGDFDTATLLKEVERTFGTIHAPPSEPRRTFSEPPQRGERRVTLHRPLPLTTPMARLWRWPPSFSPAARARASTARWWSNSGSVSTPAPATTAMRRIRRSSPSTPASSRPTPRRRWSRRWRRR